MPQSERELNNSEKYLLLSLLTIEPSLPEDDDEKHQEILERIRNFQGDVNIATNAGVGTVKFMRRLHFNVIRSIKYFEETKNFHLWNFALTGSLYLPDDTLSSVNWEGINCISISNSQYGGLSWLDNVPLLQYALTPLLVGEQNPRPVVYKRVAERIDALITVKGARLDFSPSKEYPESPYILNFFASDVIYILLFYSKTLRNSIASVIRTLRNEDIPSIILHKIKRPSNKRNIFFEDKELRDALIYSLRSVKNLNVIEFALKHLVELIENERLPINDILGAVENCFDNPILRDKNGNLAQRYQYYASLFGCYSERRFDERSLCAESIRTQYLLRLDNLLKDDNDSSKQEVEELTYHVLSSFSSLSELGDACKSQKSLSPGLMENYFLKQTYNDFYVIYLHGPLGKFNKLYTGARQIPTGSTFYLKPDNDVNNLEQITDIKEFIRDQIKLVFALLKNQPWEMIYANNQRNLQLVAEHENEGMHSYIKGCPYPLSDNDCELFAIFSNNLSILVDHLKNSSLSKDSIKQFKTEQKKQVIYVNARTKHVNEQRAQALMHLKAIADHTFILDNNINAQALTLMWSDFDSVVQRYLNYVNQPDHSDMICAHHMNVYAKIFSLSQQVNKDIHKYVPFNFQETSENSSSNYEPTMFKQSKIDRIYTKMVEIKTIATLQVNQLSNNQQVLEDTEMQQTQLERKVIAI